MRASIVGTDSRWRPKRPDVIFTIEDPMRLAYELSRHCDEKRGRQSLTEAELKFHLLDSMQGEMAGDGFIALFHEVLTPFSFTKICEALAEIGLPRLVKLMTEAWDIFTKRRGQITEDELRAIHVTRFNTQAKMDRFYELGDEVVKELEERSGHGRMPSVEYAKRHREEFAPIENDLRENSI